MQLALTNVEEVTLPKIAAVTDPELTDIVPEAAPICEVVPVLNGRVADQVVIVLELVGVIVPPIVTVTILPLRLYVAWLNVIDETF